ncbi:membrane protein insertion efficiency factor YidD [Gammaproteobacteria bacterium]|nr:membrane protein insertion efficiency factor YidD [Gammaproteobacteria bacterium]
MKKIIIYLIKFYQITLSPLLGSNCRFQPTCSQYMIEAVNLHGVFKGVGLGIKRISKCHPLGSKGYDPVPGKKE